MKKQMVKCGRGGIGRRAGFRYQWRKSWGFESLRPHHLRNDYAKRREPAVTQCGGAWLRFAGICKFSACKTAPIWLAGLTNRYGHTALLQIGRMSGHGEIKDRCFDECV